MEDKVKLLIAVGASITANCQSCLRTAVKHAGDAGVNEKEIAEAMAIGRIVRKGAAGKIDKLASDLNGESGKSSQEDCPFGASEQDVSEWVKEGDECACSE